MNKTTNTFVSNLSVKDKDDLEAIALALGRSQQAIYRDAFREYIDSHQGLVENGRAIMAKQKELRKE